MITTDDDQDYCIDERKRRRQAVFGTGLIQAPNIDESVGAA